MSLNVQSSHDEEIGIVQMLIEVWRNRWWIFLCVFLVAAVFTIAAFTITPIYRSSAVLIPASADRSSMNGSLSSALGQLGGLASLAGVSVSSNDSTTVEALAVLQSRQFTQKFIDEHDLMPKLFSSKWDAAGVKWRVGEKDQPTSAQAYRYFNDKIRMINQDKKTGLVTVQIDWKDRNEATNWANDLIQMINMEMRDRAIEKATASIGFLEKELATTSTIETRDAINRLIEVQIKQRMLATVTQEYAFRVVDKAVVSDITDPVKPKKLLLLIAGPFFGGFIGVVAVILIGVVRRPGVAQQRTE